MLSAQLLALGMGGGSQAKRPPVRPIASAASAKIEVERKFAAGDPAELSRVVTANGGTVLGEKRFHDQYWDTPQCDLTRRDTWLRRRDQQWELKLPVEEAAKRSGGERSIFREVEGSAAVAEALAPLLPGWDGAVPVEPDADLEPRLRALKLVPFAELGTVRSKYKIGQGSIDADIASFGHSVVEIEVMCSTQEEVPAAEDEIGRIASLIGAKPLDGTTGGKLETYIRRFCPDVLAQLQEVGVLR